MELILVDGSTRIVAAMLGATAPHAGQHGRHGGKAKNPLTKPESFVDTTMVDQLERSGFIDSVYK